MDLVLDKALTVGWSPFMDDLGLHIRGQIGAVLGILVVRDDPPLVMRLVRSLL
jgi:hypothetical protein